jgi:hypothetical protein
MGIAKLTMGTRSMSLSYFSHARLLSLFCSFLICGGWALAAPVAEAAESNSGKTSASSPTSKTTTYEEVRAALFAHLEARVGA